MYWSFVLNSLKEFREKNLPNNTALQPKLLDILIGDLVGVISNSLILYLPATPCICAE